jgi:fructokinase
MPEIITMGELLIDLVPTVSGVSLIEAPAFKKAAGGAPANVAVGLAKLGKSSGFIGKVGDDPFGKFLAQTLSEAGVDTTALCFSIEARTALAFVSLRADGERDFMFYRHPSADMLFKPDEVDEEYIRSAKIFHFGSISLISEPSRSATFHCIKVAQEAGLLVTYDPNLRLNLWPDAKAAKSGILQGWPFACVIKASEEEIEFLSGETDVEKGVRGLWHDSLNLVVITHGKNGSTYVTRDFSGHVPGFAVAAVDATGAGDGFVAGLLSGLADHPQAWKDEDQMKQICRYANAIGALATTRRGAIPSLPTAAQVERFMQSGEYEGEA